MVEYLTNRFKAVIGIDDIELDMHVDGEDDGSEKLRATEQTMEDLDDRIDRLCKFVDALPLRSDENNDVEETPKQASPTPTPTPAPSPPDTFSDPVEPFVADNDDKSMVGDSIANLKSLQNSGENIT